MSQSHQATYTQGSVFWHLVTLSGTSAAGLFAIVIVDLVDVFLPRFLASQNSQQRSALWKLTRVNEMIEKQDTLIAGDTSKFGGMQSVAGFPLPMHDYTMMIR